jgi:4-diphosphocytidyl-2-C-methyl-D-erythritol kinase
MEKTLSILCPAKINRSLRIFKKKTGDCLHPIVSEFCAIDLFDRLTITKTEKKKIKIVVEGKYSSGIPNNRANTIYKMATAFFTKYGFSFGLDIILQKNIPTGSGLGGGSSDAASILKILTAFVSEKNILSLKESCEVGSDIPFFLQQFSCALVGGYGEEISESLLPVPDRFGVLVFSDRISVQSAWAYEELDALREKQILLNEYKNDFESILYPHFPDLRKTAESFKSSGAKEYGITGSGSALFGFFEEESSRKKFLHYFPDAVAFTSIDDFPFVEEV